MDLLYIHRMHRNTTSDVCVCEAELNVVIIHNMSDVVRECLTILTHEDLFTMRRVELIPHILPSLPAVSKVRLQIKGQAAVHCSVYVEDLSYPLQMLQTERHQLQLSLTSSLFCISPVARRKDTL